MKQKTIQLIIAEGHPIYLIGLINIFNEVADIHIQAKVNNEKDLFKKLSERNFDLVLLDSNLPGNSCLDILKKLKTKYPRLPIFVLSNSPEERFGRNIMNANASGFLTKEAPGKHILEGVRKIADGGVFVSPSILERFAFDFSPINQVLHGTLSRREYQVFCLIARGCALVEIGEILNLSVKTISTYRTRILEKMQMKKNAELIHYALDQNLI